MVDGRGNTLSVLCLCLGCVRLDEHKPVGLCWRAAGANTLSRCTFPVFPIFFACTLFRCWRHTLQSLGRFLLFCFLHPSWFFWVAGGHPTGGAHVRQKEPMNVAPAMAGATFMVSERWILAPVSTVLASIVLLHRVRSTSRVLGKLKRLRNINTPRDQKTWGMYPHTSAH